MALSGIRRAEKEPTRRWRAVTATATVGGTKDGRENFVLCNVELGTTIYVRERKSCIEREAEMERKGKNSGFIMSCDIRPRRLKSNIKR